MHLEFLEKKTGITAEEYLISILEIVNGIQQIGASALHIVSNYILELIWGNDSLHLFDSQWDR